MKPNYETALERTIKSHSSVLCPYCGHSHSKDPEDMPWNDDDETEFVCALCDKEFICRAWVRIMWTTDGKEDI